VHIQEVRGLVARERDDPVLVELLEALWLAEALNVIARGKGMVVHCEQATLDEVWLMRPVQPDGDISLAHGEIQVLVDEDELNPHVRVDVEELGNTACNPRGA
jgi:hypothetical protein